MRYAKGILKGGLLVTAGYLVGRAVTAYVVRAALEMKRQKEDG